MTTGAVHLAPVAVDVQSGLSSCQPMRNMQLKSPDCHVHGTSCQVNSTACVVSFHTFEMVTGKASIVIILEVTRLTTHEHTRSHGSLLPRSVSLTVSWLLYQRFAKCCLIPAVDLDSLAASLQS